MTDTPIIDIVAEALGTGDHPRYRAGLVVDALRREFAKRPGLWFRLMPPPKPPDPQETAELEAAVERDRRHLAIGQAVDRIAEDPAARGVLMPVYRVAGWTPLPKTDT